MATVFIDGSAGTTGLRIHERLQERTDIQVLKLPEELRKDAAARAEMLNTADISFLCLPDAAAIEAAGMVTNPNAVIIDTSTAHRVNPEWTYGFPELAANKQVIAQSKRIANPGCHASGFVSLVAPLVKAGVLDPAAQLTCFSLTGYSGGGKNMIAQYEAPDVDPLFAAPRVYGLTQQHKHLPEMVKVCELQSAPVFVPTVAPYYAGMEVCVPVFASQVKGGKAAIQAVYAAAYETGLVHYVDEADEGGFLSAAAFTGRDDMQVTVVGNDDRLLLVSRFDNLGKGASGSAVQNMNLVLGVPESTGLNV